jgi:histidinol-phosphate aminotransferase
MFDVSQLAVAGVRALRPYEPGKPVEALEREYGVENAVKLASNENPCGPGPAALAAVRDCLGSLSFYPDGNGFALKRVLAGRHGIDAARITLGNGSNDVLELIARAFVSPDNEVVFSRHAFAVYPIVTQAVGARAVVVPARRWGNDLDALRDAITPASRVVFIANPNNPTGTWSRAPQLHDFLAALPQHVLAVIDEAYYEYASDPDMQAEGYASAAAWLDEFPNLIVTRTFSKAYGLAGLRIGYALSHAGVADYLNRVRQPFNVNAAALAAAEAALGDSAYLQHTLKVNRDGMRQLVTAFAEMGLESIPSVANFISVDVGRPAGPVYEALLHEGVIVRPVANYEMPNHLRVTVGRTPDNARFIDALRKVTGAGAS